MQLNKILSYLLIILIFTASFSACKSQEKINWSDAKEWKVYKLSGGSAFSASEKDLLSAEFVQADSISYFVKGATALPKDKTILWKDFFVASCTLNGKFRKVIFSNYGGFFYDAKGTRHYQLADSSRKDLIDYLERKAFE